MKLLWIGDAACDSGFARATHYTLEALRQQYEVSVLGLNYRGDPHTYPYPIYPAWPGGDLFGLGRITEVLRKVRPQVIVIQNDPWNIPAYLKAIERVTDVPRPVLVGAIAVDGKNQRGYALNGLDHVVFWTNFAQYEAVRGGYQGSSSVIPLGVDLSIYKPGPSEEARKFLGLPEFTWDGFIVGNVNRNQPRKRLDLSIRYFAEWMRERQVDDAFLYLHVAPTGDLGYDCDQLAGYYGLHKRFILAEPAVFHGAPENVLARTYHAFDVQLNTGVGEGWGLTTMEGMACGVPQIVGDWAALGEWPGETVVKVPCQPVCSLNKVNVIGGEVSGEHVKAALDLLYRDRDVYQNYVGLGLDKVSEPRFRWENIAAAFLEEVNAVIERTDG